MRATEARKIADNNKKKSSAELWVEEVLKKIEATALEGETKVKVYIGEGSHSDEQFVKEMNEMKDLLRELGYTVNKSSGAVPWTMATRFNYYFTIEW